MADYVFNQSERRILTDEGVLAGLETLGKQNPAMRDVHDGYRSGWLGSWSIGPIEEAEKEVQKIDAALKRLKQVAKGIDASRKISSNDPRILQFKQDLDALDGWTISLHETVMRIIALLDRKKASAKVDSLQGAMRALLAKQSMDMDPFFKDPSLFKGYMR